MDFSDPAQRRVFFDVHSGPPREGPGNLACTARALALMGQLPDAPRVLDIACGPGAQTIHLAHLLPRAHITAIDTHRPFLDVLRATAQTSGFSERIDVRLADMRLLSVAPGAMDGAMDGVMDVIWCEGAAYIMGIPQALAAWRPLLAPGGCIAFTEPVFFKTDLPDAVRADWAEYPAMTDVAGCREIIAKAGLQLLGDFSLPAEAWDDYYLPMAARLQQIRHTHAGDAVAEAVLAECDAEIAAYRLYSDCFGYQFFVAAA